MANLRTGNAAAPSDGPPKNSREAAPGQRRVWPRPWWMIFLVIMIANYLLMRVFFPEPSSITIPYTFFKKQVEAGNIADVISAGDSIQGSFKTEVTFPPARSEPPSANAPASPPSEQVEPRTSKRFKTQRPAFADP